jgi:hypothetical protein
MLAINGNEITINCFRMFESGSNLIGFHMEKVEFHIPFKFRLYGFQDFRIRRIAKFSLDSIVYKGMGLAFNQEHQALYVPQC